jgi:hypothetical protein
MGNRVTEGESIPERGVERQKAYAEWWSQHPTPRHHVRQKQPDIYREYQAACLAKLLIEGRLIYPRPWVRREEMR